MALVDQIAVKMAKSESAATYLRNDDVSVTSASDNEKQRVRTVFVRDAGMVKVHCAARAEPMNAAALRLAVEEAKGVSVADTGLENSHHVLRAAASRQEISQEEIARAQLQLLRDELEEQRGAVLRAMMLAGVSAKVARAAGYQLHEFRAAGYVKGLKAAQCTCTEVKAAGYLTSEAAQAGFGADAAKAAGYFKTIEEAKAAGYVDGLKAGGFARPKQAGFTCEEAKRGGFSLKEIWQSGYTEAREAGYDCYDVKHAGYTREEARMAGFSDYRIARFY